MIYPYNIHTHTTFCDGKNTAEEMVQAAIQKGFKVLGFSGHSHLDKAEEWAMSLENEKLYQVEIQRLKPVYEDKIEILLGIEQDLFSEPITFPYDYVIGSSHRMEKNGSVFENDVSYEFTLDIINNFYNGNARDFVEAYFELMAKTPEATKCDVVGHFDLIVKYNENNRIFDENSSWYKDAALGALKKVLQYGAPLEINTGGIYRNCRTVPYPSRFILKHIYEWGGEIVINSDSHNCDSIGYYFEESAQLAKECGFRFVKALTSKGFIDVKL